ncbi:hypothetical protein MSUIS_01430 [Mycoplasma suis KI3806]|uniref:Uncharacterized protein n=1 Tax=Mycoplasma suis (strain KI_3806) TaxID=708248 RepID=F0V314_MYCS3|nr:hypothetical protein [Mycoplasma suis]CBZ40236.1 hypothetical protein MSUIS_01430 [Mycoplasma suis KI3806]
MGLLGAVKIVSIALSIVGSTVGGGAGFSHFLRNKNAIETRKKRSLERQEREKQRSLFKERKEKASQEIPMSEVLALNKGFRAESIFKGMDGQSYVCRRWNKNIEQEPEKWDGDECQAKIKEISGENSENKFEKWFRSDLETAISFFAKNFRLSQNKYQELRNKKEGRWEIKGMFCNYKEDEKDSRKVIVICKNKNT